MATYIITLTDDEKGKGLTLATDWTLEPGESVDDEDNVPMSIIIGAFCADRCNDMLYAMSNPTIVNHKNPMDN